jgi:hypothetical protein
MKGSAQPFLPRIIIQIDIIQLYGLWIYHSRDALNPSLYT